MKIISNNYSIVSKWWFAVLCISVFLNLLEQGQTDTIKRQVWDGHTPSAIPVMDKTLADVGTKWGLVIQEITPEIARRFNLQPNLGVIVSQVVSDSAADQAGIQRGDVIRSVGWEEISSMEDFTKFIQKTENRNRLGLRVQRGESYFYVVLKTSENG
jgi:serine protease Do